MFGRGGRGGGAIRTAGKGATKGEKEDWGGGRSKRGGKGCGITKKKEIKSEEKRLGRKKEEAYGQKKNRLDQDSTQ